MAEAGKLHAQFGSNASVGEPGGEAVGA